LSCKCAIASSFRTREAYRIVSLYSSKRDVRFGPVGSDLDDDRTDVSLTLWGRLCLQLETEWLVTDGSGKFQCSSHARGPYGALERYELRTRFRTGDDCAAATVQPAAHA